VLVERIWQVLWLAPLLAVCSGILGLELSYHVGIAAGPAVALSALGFFVLALSVARIRASATREIFEPKRTSGPSG
jgi:ABC-type Mn2+/Zn2+ transport system permease subunit